MLVFFIQHLTARTILTQGWKVEDQFWHNWNVRNQFNTKVKGWGPKRYLYQKLNPYAAANSTQAYNCNHACYTWVPAWAVDLSNQSSNKAITGWSSHIHSAPHSLDLDDRRTSSF